MWIDLGICQGYIDLIVISCRKTHPTKGVPSPRPDPKSRKDKKESKCPCICILSVVDC